MLGTTSAIRPPHSNNDTFIFMYLLIHGDDDEKGNDDKDVNQLNDWVYVIEAYKRKKKKALISSAFSMWYFFVLMTIFMPLCYVVRWKT